jgi:hypothetical protein
VREAIGTAAACSAASSTASWIPALADNVPVVVIGYRPEMLDLVPPGFV